MGRDNTGKKQEEAQIQQNMTNQTADRTARDQQIGGYNSAVDKLEANPGYAPEEIAAMRGYNQNVTHAVYGSAGDQAVRHAAVTGNANDAGLMPTLARMARERAITEATANGATDTTAANAAMEGRRMIPGFRMQPAQLYAGANASQLGSSTNLVNSRMEQDSKPTFLQNLALAGVQAAGAAASGGAFGKMGK